MKTDLIFKICSQPIGYKLMNQKWPISSPWSVATVSEGHVSDAELIEHPQNS